MTGLINAMFETILPTQSQEDCLVTLVPEGVEGEVALHTQGALTLNLHTQVLHELHLEVHHTQRKAELRDFTGAVEEINMLVVGV